MIWTTRTQGPDSLWLYCKKLPFSEMPSQPVTERECRGSNDRGKDVLALVHGENKMTEITGF